MLTCRATGAGQAGSECLRGVPPRGSSRTTAYNQYADSLQGPDYTGVESSNAWPWATTSDIVIYLYAIAS